MERSSYWLDKYRNYRFSLPSGQEPMLFSEWKELISGVSREDELEPEEVEVDREIL